MPSSSKKKTKLTTVRAHPRHVPISPKNPDGITIVDQHARSLPGSHLNIEEIKSIFKNYDKKNIIYPAKGKLEKYKNADKYDDHIAIWTDYFNKKFNTQDPIHPDVIKALIGSESDFDKDPVRNKMAIGITQITRPTLKMLKNPNGEAKDFVFKKINQKDLKDPEIAIPLGIRWIFRKKATAISKLKREPTHEELIIEYKGLLKSTSDYKKAALKKYIETYEKLKSE